MGFQAENIRDRQGRSAVDPAGGRIGRPAAIGVDTVSDEPAVFEHDDLPAASVGGARRLARR
ncbi:MAG TPA: hypothetical protein VK935_14465 [Actinomycetospora sp.]|nr:hypothetical protein [Actinomycetospora sp.]